MTNILIIDDDESIEKLMQVALSDVCGSDDTVVANSSEVALLELIRNPPKVLILDINLHSPHDVTGIDILKAIRSNAAYRDMYIIVISGIDIVDPAKCVELGADVFLAKPFSPMALRSIVSARLSTV